MGFKKIYIEIELNILSMNSGNSEKSPKFLVVVERDKCTSCGTCEDMCPELFELDSESLAHIKGSKRVGNNDELELETEDCSLDASESCPVMCIHVYEDGEEMI